MYLVSSWRALLWGSLIPPAAALESGRRDAKKSGKRKSKGSESSSRTPGEFFGAFCIRSSELRRPKRLVGVEGSSLGKIRQRSQVSIVAPLCFGQCLKVSVRPSFGATSSTQGPSKAVEFWKPCKE